MADVFLSYARGDRAVAERLADALERAGKEVWFDRRISGGTTFSDVIEAELEAARKVVVLWSAESVKSGWVRDEATAASEMGKLVPVAIDGTPPPMGFRQIQTVDLTTWARKPGNPLPGELADAVALATSAAPTPGAETPAVRTGIQGRAVLAAGGVVMLGGALWAAVAAGWLSSGDDNVLEISVAPLEVSSGDAAGQALSKGLAADLARISLDATTELTVLDASQDSSNADIRLTGSAETSGGILHASIRVLGREGDGILWSKSFERTVAESGALREEIAAQTADVLTCAQTIGANKLKLAARRLFLAACDQGNGDMAAGLANLRRVVEIEPDFYPARLRAAATENAVAGNMGGSQGQAMRRHAVSEAKAVLKEHPDAVQANAILASSLEGFENWAERRRLLQLAAARPAAGVYSRLGYENIAVGRVMEGIPDLERAVASAPFGTIGIANLAEMYGFTNRLPEAVALLDKMAVRNPDSLYVGTSRFEIQARVGDPSVALSLIGRPYIGEYYSTARIAAWRALIAARQSPSANSAGRSAALALAGTGNDIPSLAEAMQHLVQLGDIDGAYRVAGRLPPQAGIFNDVWWRNYMAPFRADARFPAFIARWGQPMVWRATGKLPDYCTTEKLPYDCRKVFLTRTERE